MFRNNFLRRCPSDFDLLGPPNGFGTNFYQEFERIRQNHLRRMDENFGYFAPFRYSFFERENHFFERRNDFLNDLDPIKTNRFFIRPSLANQRIADTHRILVDCKGYSADSLKIYFTEEKRSIIILGKEGDKMNTEENFTFKEFKKVFTLPANADTLKITGSLQSNGLLIIDVPLILNSNTKPDRCEPKANEKKVHFDNSQNIEEKTVIFEEKPLKQTEEKQIRAKITEESYYKKVIYPTKNLNLPKPSEKDEILEQQEKKCSELITIDSDNETDFNKSKSVAIPIQIINRNQI